MNIKVLQRKQNFSICSNWQNYINQSVLFELYLPIIGKDAIFLYNYLIHLKNINNQAKVFFENNFNFLKKQLNFSDDKFVELLSLLEATGLLSSYVSEIDDCLIFNLEKPLSYFEFLNNEKLNKLLKFSLTEEKYKNLQYIFAFETIANGYQNISCSIDEINNFLKNKNEINNTNNFIDWKKFETDFALSFKKKITISECAKQIILNYYVNQYVPILEIHNIVNKSTVLKFNCNLFTVDEQILDNEFQNYLEIQKQNEKKQLNRNFAIFDFEADLNSFNDVIADYQNYVSENYLLMLAKQNVSFDILHNLKIIKNKFCLDDSCLNVIIDYSIFKNCGRIEINYIYKLAATLNNLNLNDCKKAIIYFQYVNAHKNVDFNLYKTDLEQQTNTKTLLIDKKISDEIWK